MDNPSNASDVVELIRGARKKFDIPNPATEQAESAPLRAFGLQSFIKLDLPERKMLFGPWLKSPPFGPELIKRQIIQSGE